MLFDDDFQEEIDEFLADFSFIARSILDNPKWLIKTEAEELVSDSIDLVDGRLFRAVIQSLYQDSFSDIPEEFRHDWDIVSNIIKKLSGLDLSLTGSHKSTSINENESDKQSGAGALGVLAFSSMYIWSIHASSNSE